MHHASVISHPALSSDGTAAHAAYAQLKDLITRLEFAPGSTIHEATLQERLGIGRTPLREALHRLAQERMIQIYPRRAIVVAKLGVTEIRQIFETRVIVESAAAGLAAERCTAEDIEGLVAIGADLHARRSEIEARAFLEADQRFHRQVGCCAQNMILEEMIDRLQSLNLWLWHMYFSSNSAHREDLFAHEPIIEAIIGRDQQAATEAMRRHVLASKEQLLSGL